MARAKLTYPLKECFFQGGVLEGEILLQGLRVELFLIGGVGQYALDLRGEEKASFRERIVKGFDAERIPRRVELLLCLVPDPWSRTSESPWVEKR